MFKIRLKKLFERSEGPMPNGADVASVFVVNGSGCMFDVFKMQDGSFKVNVPEKYQLKK